MTALVSKPQDRLQHLLAEIDDLVMVVAHALESHPYVGDSHLNALGTLAHVVRDRVSDAQDAFSNLSFSQEMRASPETVRR